MGKPPFNPEALSRIVADSPDRIRKCDVFRLIDNCGTAANRAAMVSWLASCRPDLLGEVVEVMDGEFPDDNGYKNRERARLARHRLGNAAVGWNELDKSVRADAICDAISNLLHLCNEEGIDVSRMITRAQGHFAFEVSAARKPNS